MPALYPLRNFQLGAETVHGTAVAATWRMVGDAVLTPGIDRYMSDYPRGVMTPVTAGGTPIRQGTTITRTTDLTYEELWYHLMLSMATGTVAGGAADKTWTFAPILTGDPLIKTATAEWVLADGSGTVFAFPGATGYPLTAQVPYLFCAGFDIGWNFNQIATLNPRYEGRPSIFSSVSPGAVPTGALTPLTGRERIASNQFKIYLDTTWAGLGGTLLSGTIRSGRLSFNPGIDADYTTEGRTDLGFTQLVYGRDRFFTLNLTMEVNTTSAAEIKAWVAQNAGGGAIVPNSSGGGNVALRFVRIEATSPNVLGGTARRFRIDNSFIYTQPPSFSQQGKIELVTLNLKTEYDPVSANAFAATVVNSLATFT